MTRKKLWENQKEKIVGKATRKSEQIFENFFKQKTMFPIFQDEFGMMSKTKSLTVLSLGPVFVAQVKISSSRFSSRKYRVRKH